MVEESSSSDTVTTTEKNWAMAAHLSGFVLLLGVPIGHLLGPLIVWMIKKDESPYVRDHAREALNFHISFTLYAAIGVLLTYLFIGFILLPVIFLSWVVLMIRAGLKAGEGSTFTSPYILHVV